MKLENHYRKEIIIGKEYYDKKIKKRLKDFKEPYFASYVKWLIRRDLSKL